MGKNVKPIADAVDKYSRRTAQAGPDYQKGVQNAQNWAQNAVAAAPRRNAGLIQAANDGRIDRGIERVGDQGWRAAALSKGVSSYTANTPKAAQKFGTALQTVYNDISAAKAATDNMDTTTVEGRIAKASAFQLAMHRSALSRKTGR